MREQSRSGWSIRRFCAVHGLRETSFYFWRRELDKRRREGSRSLPGRRRGRTRSSGSDGAPLAHADGVRPAAPPEALFLPVRVSPAAASAEPGSIEILLADAVVRVPAGFDAESLARVLQALRAGGEARPC